MENFLEQFINAFSNNMLIKGLVSEADIESLKQLYASGDYRGIQGWLAGPGSKFHLNSEQTQWLNNMIAQQSVLDDHQFQTDSRDTALLSSGSQLQQLGLSPSGVLQTGGASSGVTSQPANIDKTNIALNRYNQRMQLARQLLSMTSSMASAGIYGNAIAAAKKSSALLSAQAAHSARMVTKYDANDNRVGRSISEVLDPDFDFGSLF